MQLLSIKVENFECGIQVNQKWLNWQKVVENSPVFLIALGWAMGRLISVTPGRVLFGKRAKNAASVGSG